MEHRVANIDKYNKEMSANIADKAWSLEYLHRNFHFDVDTVIDFGCADGALGKYLADSYPVFFQYIGIDIAEVLDQSTLYRGIEDIDAPQYSPINLIDGEEIQRLTKKPFILVLNSVLHELMTDPKSENNKTAFNILHALISDKNCKYISIRDMHFSDKNPEGKISISTLINFYTTLESTRPECLDAFLQFFRDRTNCSSKDWFKYLLCYDYLDNIEKEIAEKYFFDWDDAFYKIGLVTNSFATLYCENFSIPFLENKWERDFGFTNDLWCTTHRRMLLKRVEK